MEIRMGGLLRGAREAVGTVVIIDVFRAFTTAAVAFLREAEEIIFVGEIDDALRLKAEGAGDVCVGEVGGRMPEGFDYNNSPFELCRADLSGKTVIQSTRAGTVGVEAASNADRIYAGALVHAKATAGAIRNLDPKVVSLVAMGWQAEKETEEDTACACYLQQLLRGRSPDPYAVRPSLVDSPEYRKFDDPGQPHFHPRDRDIALAVDTVPFAIRVDRDNGLLIGRKEPVPEVEAEMAANPLLI